MTYNGSLLQFRLVKVCKMLDLKNNNKRKKQYKPKPDTAIAYSSCYKQDLLLIY